MLKFYSLYSGSSGNSLLVETPNSKVLIDAGVSTKKIETALSDLEVDIHDIDAVLVTHEHSDHVKGLGTLAKKFNIFLLSTSIETLTIFSASARFIASILCGFISFIASLYS